MPAAPPVLRLRATALLSDNALPANPAPSAASVLCLTVGRGTCPGRPAGLHTLQCGRTSMTIVPARSAEPCPLNTWPPIILMPAVFVACLWIDASMGRIPVAGRHNVPLCGVRRMTEPIHPCHPLTRSPQHLSLLCATFPMPPVLPGPNALPERSLPLLASTLLLPGSSFSCCPRLSSARPAAGLRPFLSSRPRLLLALCAALSALRPQAPLACARTTCARPCKLRTQMRSLRILPCFPTRLPGARRPFLLLPSWQVLPYTLCLKQPGGSAPSRSGRFCCFVRPCVPANAYGLVPAIACWADYCYGQASHLRFGDRVLPSTCGVQQGDPLGPLLFALALQPALRAAAAHPVDLRFSYLDDVVIAGPAHHVARAMRDLVAEARRAGLLLEPSKCQLILSPDAAPNVDMLLFPSGLPVVATRCFELLGAPIGPDAFCQHYSSQTVDRATACLDAVAAVPDPQTALLLLRHCVSYTPSSPTACE